MDLCPILDAAGTATGRTVTRGTPLGWGEYHLVVHVWVRNELGEYLIQQRAHDLASDPGAWATTAGYVLAGEESLAAALRETREELGLALPAGKLRRLERLTTDDRLEDLWLAEVDGQALGVPAAGPEVAGWKWVSKRGLRRLIGQGGFFAYSYFERLPE
jgi:8-oxo-dGTP pyrophosphatase MutT (NUDIX family)